MNPHVTRGGKSFRGAFLYYMHDREEDTRERIAWTHTANMMTDDPDKAWKVMAYTAKSQERLKEASGQKMTGRKMEKPVMAYSLSWHPDHDPDKEHMLETAMGSLKVLGLDEHEALIVAHRDTPHRHVHVMANRVHPITGKVASDSNSYRKLSEFAYQYQRAHGMDYCPQREENRNQRGNSQPTRYRDPKISEAWKLSDDGKSFAAALEERGYRLAQGRNRPVVVDPYGKTHNPVRHIEGIKARDLKDRLDDIDMAALKQAEAVAMQREFQHQARQKQATILKENFRRQAQAEAEAKKLEVDKAEQAKREQVAQKKEEKPSRQPQLTPQKPEPEVKPKLSDEERRRKECDELDAQHQREMARRANELAEFYKLEEQKSCILELRQKLDQAAWWKKFFGFTRKDSDKLWELEMNRQDAQKRYDEQMEKMRRERDRQLEEMRERQRREMERGRGQVSQSPGMAAEFNHAPEQSERDKLIEKLREDRLKREAARRDRGGPGMRR